MNYYLYISSHDRFWLNGSHQMTEFDSDNWWFDKCFCSRGFYCKTWKTSRPKILKLLSRTNYWQKTWCILFACRPPDTNKTFFDEIFFSLNKILGKYDSILPAGGWYIDELNPSSDLSNHLSDAKGIFNLTILVKKPTCFKSPNGTLIDLMLTNRPESFLKSQKFEIGSSYCHKLVPL